MTRFWPAGQTITITGEAENTPVTFTWQGQTHGVDEIVNSWRVDVDWWRGRVWRAYFKLSTDTGLLVILYQDLLSGEWFIQRLYD